MSESVKDDLSADSYLTGQKESAIPDFESPSLKLLLQAFVVLCRDKYVTLQTAALFDNMDVDIERPDPEQDPIMVFKPAVYAEDGAWSPCPALEAPLTAFMADLAHCGEEIEGLSVDGMTVQFDSYLALLDLAHAFVEENEVVTWDTLEFFSGLTTRSDTDDAEDDAGDETQDAEETTDLDSMVPANLAEVFYHLAQNGATSRIDEKTLNPAMLYNLPGRPYNGRADLDAMTSKMMKLFNQQSDYASSTINLQHIAATIFDEIDEPNLHDQPYYRMH